jgi:hypothetical protein
MLVAFLQLLFMIQFRQTACWARHWLAAANRCYRMVLVALIAARTRYNVLGIVSIWFSEPTQDHVKLAACTLVPSLIQLQINLNFLLPIRSLLFLQLISTALMSALLVNAPAAMAAVPRLPAAAQATCSTLHTIFGGPLHVSLLLNQHQGGPHSDWAVWLSGQQQYCEIPRAFAQLQLFALLIVGFHLPLVMVHALELHQKVSFYKARGFTVKPDQSAYLPFPGRPWVNCFSALVLWPILLWCCATAAAEAWLPTEGEGAAL